MSKSSKTKRSLERRKKKRDAKIAEQARYDSYRDIGQNTKSKRYSMRTVGRRGVRPVRHRLGPCGNVGCQRCNPKPAALRYNGSTVLPGD